ncbi:MAG: ABC transporter substrate-binding protein [Gammaproteobacteria bacterium]
MTEDTDPEPGMIKNLWRKLLPGVAMTKGNMFLVIIVAIGLLSILGSLVARWTVLDKPEGTPLTLALIAPQNGEDAEAGFAMEQGLELAIAQINGSGGIGGRPVELLRVDEEFIRGERTRVAAKLKEVGGDGGGNLVAIIGPYGADNADAVSGYAQAQAIPLLIPSSVQSEAISGNDWVFSTLFNEVHQTRFLANYARNVVGEKTATVIHSDSERGQRLFEHFDKTYRRFGTKVLNHWAYSTEPDELRSAAQSIAAEVKARKLAGIIFVEGSSSQAAAFLVALRDAGVRNPVVGLAMQATNAFVFDVARRAAEGKTAADYINGMLVTTPLLFDTATEVAQNFRNAFVERYRSSPDWPAAYAYDAARLLADTLTRHHRARVKADAAAAKQEQPVEVLRKVFWQRLAEMIEPERAYTGTAGQVYFTADGESAMPVQMGLYNGSSMISALTQLQPITEGGVTGYLDLLKEGKVLYVNDRFMYKTNVVYTGVQLFDVTDLDVDANSAQLDFLVWFRYRGRFEPQDIVFENAVDPIKLEEPERELVSDEMIYRAYRVTGKFQLNFVRVEREYGSELIGLGFHHRTLSNNNLMYVTDVLGMGLASDRTLLEVLNQDVGDVASRADVNTGGSAVKDLASALGYGEAGATLLDKILEGRVLAPLSGWTADRAWISQELLHGSSEGDPTYVGYGRPRPDFSQINFGMVLAPERIDARDFIPANWFVYVVITCLVAILFAVMMDRRDRGQFWRMQTIILRIGAWPLLLLAGGALVLDYAVSNYAESTVDMIVMVYDSLWWLIPARLAAIAMERFVWVPLEIRSGRMIPNVVRIFAAGTIYLLGIFGVVAFVFDQKLTSLLATSGLLAMIIGLAVQANIANVFSGIVLNIERPFKVGDWIGVGDLPIGRVADITWRTTRLIPNDGFSISLPNAQVSESNVINYTSDERVRISVPVLVDVHYDPEVVIEAIKAGLSQRLDLLVPEGDGPPIFDAHHLGTEVVDRDLFGKYLALFWVPPEGFAKRGPVQSQVMTQVWKALEEAGVEYRLKSPRSVGFDAGAPGAVGG